MRLILLTLSLLFSLNSNSSIMEKESVIYLAGGCFWGTEHFLKQINGVNRTDVGYANSMIKDPTYEEVCTGKTNAAETVKVIFNPDVLPLSLLLELYFKTIDPTSLNKQGGDRGTQYRTGIYYTDTKDKKIIDNTISILSAKYSKPIVIEVKPIENFYNAELYHQDYLDKNPSGYCHINPQLFKFAREANKK
jgi:peptide methionine sulfoxide reductase msrA/msrB